ncbi:MAG: hypothetical protein LBT21_06950 [Oscillospiraceae bacterium]|nr:hypothetical protein [Oscillospiraceae bacterium]
MKQLRKALAVFLAALFALSTFAAAAFGVAAASTSRVTKNTDFIALNDPLEAFSRLGSFGVELASPDSRDFPEDIIVVNSNHIQGVARYGDYTIISVNAYIPSGDPGYLFFYSATKLLGYFQVPSGSHTGGIGIAGDYLVIPAAQAYIYDISSLKNGVLPSSTPVLSQDIGIGGGSLSATIVPYNGGTALLLSDSGFGMGIVPLPIMSGSTVTRLTVNSSAALFGTYSEVDDIGWGANNEALVTDTNGDAWLFVLTSKIGLPGKAADLLGEAGVNYEDAVTLYKIELNGTSATVTGPYAEKLLEPFDSYLLALGSHYRFAASVQVLDADNFAVISTPSLPGNLFIKYVSGTAKSILDLVRPNVLPVNANVTRPVGSAAPTGTANIESRSLLNWLYQVLYWFLTIVNLDYLFGKLGINI